jgi:hypothetical protein
MDEYGIRNLERGRRASYECGAEYQANPGSNRREYFDSAAFYFRNDVEYFNDLTLEEKNILMEEFWKGVKAEKALQ